MPIERSPGPEDPAELLSDVGQGGASRQGPESALIDVCPVCGESTDLALIKGCLRCLKCGFKWDCNGW